MVNRFWSYLLSTCSRLFTYLEWQCSDIFLPRRDSHLLLYRGQVMHTISSVAARPFLTLRRFKHLENLQRWLYKIRHQTLLPDAGLDAGFTGCWTGLGRSGSMRHQYVSLICYHWDFLLFLLLESYLNCYQITRIRVHYYLILPICYFYNTGLYVLVSKQ